MAISRWMGTVSSLVLAAVFASHDAEAQNASKIGVASAVKNRVEGSAGGGSRALLAGSEVFAREVVRTGEQSTAQLLFLDETSLSIGPQSEVTLDRFVYDQKRGAGSVVLNATRGAFRFASGSQQSSSYQIRTPVATIGVRGTLFDVYIAKNAQGQWTLVLILVEGATSVTFGGKVYDLSKPGQALIISPPGQVQQVNWDSTLFSVVSSVPFPLFGNHWPSDPHWTQITNFPADRVDQLLGSGPTFDPYGGYGN
ncbi:MAG: FecR domain-containing protein [Bradyrhizobiaceae bacterium]|nr:FecR domain-containing protein [Bradyrhizobiaceae bacterium]